MRAIARTLLRAGYELEHRASRPKGEEEPRRFEAPWRNALWQLDLAELQIGGEHRSLLIIEDDFSRFLVHHALMEHPSSEAVAEELRKAIVLHGKPDSVYTDRGGQFLAWLESSSFQRVLEELLIDHHVTPAYKPRGRGKIEATIRTLRRELWEVTHFDSVEEAERGIAELLREYNHRRAHMGIDGLVPADRLRREHGISLKTFASKLGIPGRTLRYWRKRTRPPAPPGDTPREAEPVTSETGKLTEEEPAPGSSAPTPASLSRGRFSLEVIPPGLQVMADTTDICAFGVDLKLVGAQDAGNRHRSLLESFSVSETESAEIVLDVISRAFPDPSGTQAIVDQGTPYMAKATREALEELETEHCPQKEATPTDKAPLERPWRTIKVALEPLLRLTNRVAESVLSLPLQN